MQNLQFRSYGNCSHLRHLKGRALKGLLSLLSFTMVLKPEFWWTWGHSWTKTRVMCCIEGIKLYPGIQLYGDNTKTLRESQWTNQYVMECHKVFLKVVQPVPFRSPLVSWPLGFFPGDMLLIALLRGSLGTLRGVTVAKALGGGRCRSDGCHLRSGTHARAISPGVLGDFAWGVWEDRRGTKAKGGPERRDFVVVCLFGEGVGSLGEIPVRSIFGDETSWSTYASRCFCVTHTCTCILNVYIDDMCNYAT